MRERISVSVPEELKDEIDRVTKAEGVSRSHLVRAALRQRFFGRRLRALRRELRPYAEAQGVHSDDDVFRFVS